MHKLPPYKQKERQTKQKENVKKEMGPQPKKPNGFLNHHMLQTINELQESEFLIQKGSLQACKDLYSPQSF